MSRRTAMNPPTSGPVAAPPLASQLANTLTDALVRGEAALRSLAGAAPPDRRDRVATLLTIYDLHTAPLETVRAVARWQGHPAVAAIKFRLEGQWLAELEASYAAADIPAAGLDTVDGAVAAIRAIAAKDRLPTAYRWLANEATWPEVVNFLALEGGPDGGFDDLIALCQVGLAGSAKLELAQNFWDEMGDGDPDGVHTTLHQRLVAAIDMPRVPRAEQPVEALERVALNGLLATNRWLQPEMLGALGLLELQAGPRCRLVLQGFDRLGAPAAAYPFYAEHAEVDPRHGRDWVDKAIMPTVAAYPPWAADRARRLVALAAQPGLPRGGPDRPRRAPQRRLSGQNARVPTHVALLRGINVGGRNRVAMADLREVVTSLGHTEVTTYVQSGNVVFTSPDADTGALVAALEQRIGERRTPSACTHCSEAPSSVPTRPAPTRPRSSAPRSWVARTRRAWSGARCSCVPRTGSVAASWPPSWLGPERTRPRATGPPSPSCWPGSVGYFDHSTERPARRGDTSCDRPQPVAGRPGGCLRCRGRVHLAVTKRSCPSWSRWSATSVQPPASRNSAGSACHWLGAVAGRI